MSNFVRAINFTQNLVTSACENSTLRGFLFLLGRGNGEISLHREKQPNLKVPSPVLQPALPTFMSYYPQGLNSKWSDLFFPFPGILYLQMLTLKKLEMPPQSSFLFFFFSHFGSSEMFPRGPIPQMKRWVGHRPN